MNAPNPNITGKGAAPGNAEFPLGEKDSDIPQKGWYSRGYLPHRDEIGLLQTITIRLADSLPQSKLRQLEEELKHLPEDKRDAHRRATIEKWLDAGMGCCALRHPAVVQNALLHADGLRYRLLAWCIMPNHAHILIQPLTSLPRIVQAWKGFTGNWAMSHNVELGLGIPGKRFWQREMWDRYIRDETHLRNAIVYIHENPVKARLCRVPEAWRWSSAFLAEKNLGAPGSTAPANAILGSAIPGNAAPGSAKFPLGE
jgi:REP element-mobilizing transposase RayT